VNEEEEEEEGVNEEEEEDERVNEEEEEEEDEEERVNEEEEEDEKDKLKIELKNTKERNVQTFRGRTSLSGHSALAQSFFLRGCSAFNDENNNHVDLTMCAFFFFDLCNRTLSLSKSDRKRELEPWIPDNIRSRILITIFFFSFLLYFVSHCHRSGPRSDSWVTVPTNK
jgi:hypothetical protein